MTAVNSTMRSHLAANGVAAEFAVDASLYFACFLCSRDDRSEPVNSVQKSQEMTPELDPDSRYQGTTSAPEQECGHPEAAHARHYHHMMTAATLPSVLVHSARLRVGSRFVHQR